MRVNVIWNIQMFILLILYRKLSMIDVVSIFSNLFN